jgi:hypothetical protein
VDINENALTELSRDLRSEKELYVPENYITYPMSYADPVFEKIFKKQHGYDIVANFSAHKHVRSEKDRFSVEVLIENNVLHAAKLLTLLQKYPPEHYFCVSTDKAANPVNIMGASKKIMEEMIMAYADKDDYSNVDYYIGIQSRGSVTGIIYIYFTVGLIGVVLILLFILSWYPIIKYKRFRYFLLFTVLFDFVFYNAQTIFSIPMFTLLLFIVISANNSFDKYGNFIFNRLQDKFSSNAYNRI